MSQGLHRIIIIIIVFALGVSTPARGDACGNVVVATDKTVAAVKEAETILNNGDHAEAVRRIHALLEHAPERNLCRLQ